MMNIRMNRSFACKLTVLLSGFFLTSAAATAQSPRDTLNILNVKERVRGFHTLFNGRDLTGWRAVGSNKPPEKGWVVESGLLHVLPSAEGSSERGGDIVTVQKYSAFELRFDFKLTEGANSGVKYFVMDTLPTPKSGLGLEYQLLDDERHPDAKLGRDGDRTLGSLYDLIPADKTDTATRKPIGEWNHARIVVYPSGLIEHWLNGVKVLQYVRGGGPFMEAVAKSKFAGIPGFGLSPGGPILLQDHGNSVYFANIRIRELK